MSQDTFEQWKETGLDVLNIFKLSIINPPGIYDYFTSVKEKDIKQIKKIGIFLGIVNILFTIISLNRLKPFLEYFLSAVSINIVKINTFTIGLLGIIHYLSIFLAIWAVQKLFKGKANIEEKLFFTGLFLIPAIYILLALNILGIGNFEVIAFVFLFCGSFSYYILQMGLNKICNIDEKYTIYGQIIVLIASIWLTKTMSFIFIR